jgi:thioesterase domain-containing protein
MTALVSADGEQAPSTGARPAAELPNGVRVQRLRNGTTDETLFVVPGLEGDVDELTAMVDAFTGPQQIYALVPMLQDTDRQPITTVERMAELMVAAVRDLSPAGPYRLAGYSFGALVAMEMAQQLRAAGDRVAALFLIEAVYDERYWPRRIWLRALVRRTSWQLTRILRMRPSAAIAEFRLRAGRLIQRVIRRNTSDRDPLHATAADADTTMNSRAYGAISQYQPRRYEGPMTLIASSRDRHFGCDTTEIWAGYARHLEIERIDGDHLTVMHDPASAAAVARVIDHRLALHRTGWAGLQPVPGFERPLIVTTMRWFSAARLGHALAEAGFVVSACRPGSHALELVDGLAVDCRLHKFWPLRSLTAAIRRANPDLILCDDERALAMVRRLHARVKPADPDMAALIARSLGNVADWPLIASRAGLADEARKLNLRAPETAVITDQPALDRWLTGHDVPFVLKTDGSWGGQGVAVVRDPARLPKIWQTISNPPSVTRGLKRAVIDMEPESLLARIRGIRPVVNAQEFCPGSEAIVTVACVDGTVLALICLEVVQTCERQGPAAAVRVINHPEMAETARLLVRRFGLSGFCGFDFIIDDSGEARLVELNPRVTPTCHLLVEGGHRSGRLIALFPNELSRDPTSEIAVSGVLDVPTRAPQLIDRGIKLAAKNNHLTARTVRRIKRRVGGSGLRAQA